jgi:hypothetical protein
MSKQLCQAAGEEFEGLSLGDRRLQARAVRMVKALALRPGASILDASRTDAEAEANYRLLRNRRVTMDVMLEPHLRHTAQRCASVGKILVVHDTSGFEYEGNGREGLGRVRTGTSQGFLFHASLAVEAGTRQPLGLIGSKVWTRTATRTSVAQGRNGPRKKSGSDYARAESKESDRWGEQIQASTKRLSGTCPNIVHVADREADIYALLAVLHERCDRFVIRLARDKKAREAPNAEPESLVQIATRAHGCVEIDVPVTARIPTTMPSTSKTFPPREARIARLEFAATSAQIHAPSYAKQPEACLPIHVVHVREIGAPSGHDPVEWLLLTSESIATEANVREVVEIYRSRWVIEEFFKALKTGCAMEKRELESLHTLTNALALCIPIAYLLLALRHLARSSPQAPAQRVMSDTQIAILQAKARLAVSPTAQQALEAVAYLGSHFVPFTKKKPGWRVLARGMERRYVSPDPVLT